MIAGKYIVVKCQGLYPHRVQIIDFSLLSFFSQAADFTDEMYAKRPFPMLFAFVLKLRGFKKMGASQISLSVFLKLT